MALVAAGLYWQTGWACGSEPQVPDLSPPAVPADLATDSNSRELERLTRLKQEKLQALETELRRLRIRQQAGHNVPQPTVERQSPALPLIAPPELPIHDPLLPSRQSDKQVEQQPSVGNAPATTPSSSDSAAPPVPLGEFLAESPNDASSVASTPLPSVKTPVTEPAEVPLVPSVLTGEIDRMGLANSLFATGRHAECLQTLEAIENGQLSAEDAAWKLYLMANCERRLGNRSEAARIYRVLTGNSDQPWLSDLAKWWLGQLQAEQALRSKEESLQPQLQTPGRSAQP
jgi:hypothetical protein